MWLALMCRWIELLPLLTTTAAYPLFNCVLAANLEPLLPSSLRSRTIAALLCGSPPIVCALLVRDPTLIFSLCGLAGFFVVFIIVRRRERSRITPLARLLRGRGPLQLRGPSSCST